MQDLMLQMSEFVNGSSFFVYVFIIFGKILEVSISTLRIVLVSKGQKLIGSIIGSLEYLIWLMVTGLVLSGIQEDVFKMFCLAFAFGIGVYIGILIEGKLAIGISAMNVIIPDEEQCEIVLSKLREEGYGVTVLDGHGIKAKRQLLYMVINRKALARAVEIVETNAPCAVMFVSDMNTRKGGYVKNMRRKVL